MLCISLISNDSKSKIRNANSESTKKSDATNVSDQHPFKKCEHIVTCASFSSNLCARVPCSCLFANFSSASYAWTVFNLFLCTMRVNYDTLCLILYIQEAINLCLSLFIVIEIYILQHFIHTISMRDVRKFHLIDQYFIYCYIMKGILIFSIGCFTVTFQ